MNRTLMKLTKGALLSGAILLGAWSTPAQAQVQITISPPVWFRATAQPVYYEGHASYFYEGRWYYREGREWRHYRTEPSQLREHRHKHKSGGKRHRKNR